MIFKELSNSNPMPLCGMATKIDTSSVSVPSTPFSPDFCYCGFECDECYDVWGGGSLSWQNDKSTFAFIKTIPNDTFSLSLFKNGVSVATIIDNSYGDYKPTYINTPKQYSFVIDWNLVFQAFGNGDYTLKNTFTSLLVADEFISQAFCLSEYNDRDANGYTKLDWFQNGDILNSPFNFCEPLFYSVKMKSVLSIDNPKTIKDSYATSSRQVKQFRVEQINNYTLKTNIIDESLLTLLNENMVLAEKLTFTDFNLFGTNFKERDLTFIDVIDLNDHSETRKLSLSIKFEDYVQNIIKENCC